MTSSDRGRRPTARYRVEHHVAGRIRALGVVDGVPAHHASLEPFISELLRGGASGQVLLIDDATGAIVARRRVRPYGTKPRDRFRPSEI